MSPSNSVIRRYTPPTCTLEISAQNSPLSRWTDKTVISDLSFSLRFDDPRLPEADKILVQGDRRQLEILCDIVTTYVQTLLQQSAEDFSITLLGSDHPHATSEPEITDIPPSVPPTPNISSFKTQIPQTKIYLEPSHNLTHQLFFGDLANQTSGQVIELTLLQLFDLATALDEYSSDMVVLPTTSHQIIKPSLPQWAPIAAVLVLAAGLTPFTWQYANNIQKNRQKVANNVPHSPEPVAIEPTQQDPIPTPSLPLITPQPQLTPPLPNLSTPAPPLSFPNATIPAAPSKTSQPPLTIPSDTSSYPLTSQVPLPGIIPNANITQVTKAIPNASTIPNKKAVNPTKSKNVPSDITQLSPSIATIPNNNLSNISNLIPTPAAAELAPSVASNTTPQQPSPIGNQDSLASRLRTATKPTSDTQTTDNKTLFDTPQIAEAREYLNKRWQPPTGLSQTLEYSLTLGIDGKIERILPLNQVAREYIDSSGIPEIGKPFVSSNKAGQNLRIRVILSPDSKVQTFPETP
ncbi:DUF4335 domain-containing protein [Dolichospermum compactum]|uniref:DUF4335 domain-containing protein n=1 Tax=Dolichospermum compactum NIES-806 TaxID=1973481 RepID=A0A1Z4V9G5_9CYAN|nr:DUF4335 domain-containing protein [Dolichospermum compactum]BAZ88221.1 hypothetical protein NIES806_44570 [Dolichospermum compactum NIES-806]